jgi:hypothetical protein
MKQNKPNSRRRFIKQAGLLTAATNLGIFAAAKEESMNANQPFIHHVYFWLHNPENKDDYKKLIEGLQKLSKVKTIKDFYIGKPADTKREVIDSSYSVSWLLFFKNRADQDSYQTDPVHLKFVEECSHLWKKVVVYDTVDAV